MLNDLTAMLNNVSLFELVQEAAATRGNLQSSIWSKKNHVLQVVPGSSGAHGG
jgi:hypothetical protein